MLPSHFPNLGIVTSFLDKAYIDCTSSVLYSALHLPVSPEFHHHISLYLPQCSSVQYPNQLPFQHLTIQAPPHLPLYPSRKSILNVHISKACNYLSSHYFSVQVSAPYRSMLQTKHFTILFLSFMSSGLHNNLFFIVRTSLAKVILPFTS